MKLTTTHLFPKNKFTGHFSTKIIKLNTERAFSRLWAFILMTLFTNAIWANCTMVCNNLVNVSLGPSCEAEIMYDMILEDPDNPLVCVPNGPTAYVVFVMDEFWNVIPTSPVVTSDYIGQTLPVKVKHLESGNYCWGSINVEDNLGPILSCPVDISIACTDPTDPTFTGEVEAEDCSDFTTSYSDFLEIFGCNNPVAIITRTFTGLDEHGNSSNCQQFIYIEQPTISSVQFPPNLGGNSAPALDCVNPDTDPSNTGFPTINGSPIQNGGLCNMAVTYSDNPINLCGGTYDILRTWTVAEWCSGIVVTHIQIIKVADTTGPVLACPPDLTAGTTSSLYCTASVMVPPIQVSDDCSTSFSYQVATPGGVLNSNGGLIHNIFPGTYPITYTVSDACGNQSSCQITLTVIDNVAPAVICDEFTVVTLQPDGFATVFAQTFDDGSYDNCCLDHFEVRRMNAGCGQGTGFGPIVTFCCEDIGEDVPVEFKAVDCVGNANFCMVTVHVDDKTNPLILCPPPITIVCTDDYTDQNLTGEPVVSDGCGIASLSHIDQVDLNACQVGTVLRTWTVTDVNDNTSSCSQLITVVDTSSVTVTFPPDFSMTDSCMGPEILHPDSLPAPYDFPLFSGNECELMATNWDDQLFQIAPPACFKIVRTWTIVNWCDYDPNSGNTNGFFQSQQILKAFDDEPPVLNCPDDLTVEILGSDCVTDVSLPVASAMDCSQNTSVSVTSDFGNGLGPFDNIEGGTYQAIYQASDGCGNSTSCAITITVVDGKKPTPLCDNGLVVELMPTAGEIEVWAIDFDEGSFDNCPGPIKFSFSADVSNTSTTFDCFDLGQNIVEIWVTDVSGNQDYCETHLVVQDNMGACNPNPLTAMIAGMVTDEMGYKVEEVTVSVNDSITPIVTGGNGEFAFSDLPTGDDYTISPQKDMNPRNGVTTWDIVLLRRHILFMEPLDSPYKRIAADANNSGNLTTADMVAIQKLVLFIHDDFPNANSWRFVDKNYVFPDPDNPWAEPFPEIYNINNLDNDMTDVNFIGIKVGDLNNNAIPNMLVNSDDRSNENLVFEMEDINLQSGREYKIDFKAKGFSKILGYQFTLEFDPEALEFVRFVRGELALSEHNFGTSRSGEGILTTSWHDITKQSLHEDAVLFSLVFTAEKNESLSKTMKINSKWTRAEAYNEDGENMGVILRFGENSGILFSKFELHQNQPNPFHSATIVSFSLPETQKATLRIYDVSGGLLKTVTDVLAKGENRIEVKADNLPGPGAYIFQLETAAGTETKKMILMR